VSFEFAKIMEHGWLRKAFANLRPLFSRVGFLSNKATIKGSVFEPDSRPATDPQS
jgi:hypothetical protein